MIDFKRFALLLTPLLLATSSCGTNPGIQVAQNFGALSDQFKDNANKLANDIYDSCIRRVRYIQVDTLEGNQSRDTAFNQCEELNKPTAADARNANQVIINYMEAIGRLASDEVVSFDDQFDRIETSLNQFSIPINDGNTTRFITLPQGSVSTGVQIANFIFGWVTNRIREGSLKEAITCTNKSFQAYVDGLESTFRDGYIDGILAQEQSRVVSYYNYYAALLRAQDGSDKDFRSLQQESFESIESVLNRRNAALLYLDVIGSTSNAHAEVAEVFLDGDPAPSKSYCNSTYFAQSDSGTEEVGVLAGEDYLTIQESVRVEKIISNYQRDIAPLLAQMQEELQ